MEKAYWLGRKGAALQMAQEATSGSSLSSFLADALPPKSPDDVIDEMVRQIVRPHGA